MKHPSLACAAASLGFFALGCTHHTVVYQPAPAQPTYRSSAPRVNREAGPPRTLPGTPVRARETLSPQNFDAQSL